MIGFIILLCCFGDLLRLADGAKPIDLVECLGNSRPLLKNGAWEWDGISIKPEGQKYLKVDPQQSNATVAIVRSVRDLYDCFTYRIRKESLVIDVKDTDMVVVCLGQKISFRMICGIGKFYDLQRLSEIIAQVKDECAIFKPVFYERLSLDDLYGDFLDFNFHKLG